MLQSGPARAALVLAACTAVGLFVEVRTPGDAEGFGSYPLGLLALVLLHVTGRTRLIMALVAWACTGLAMYVAGQSPAEAVLYSLGGVLAAAAALELLHARGGPPWLRREADVLRLLLAAVLGAAIVSAAAAVAGWIIDAEYPVALVLATMLNTLASLLLWLPLATRRHQTPALAPRVERIAQWLLAIAVSVLVLSASGSQAFAYAVLAVLAWGALRLTLLEVLIQLIVVRVIAMAWTTYDRGPFSPVSHGATLPDDLQTAYAQLFLITCSVVVITMNLSSARARHDTRREAFARAGADADSRLSDVFEALEAERSALQELREVDRVKDAFVSTVSHELRTPITNIIGYTELLDDGDYGQLSPLQGGALERIGENGRRLLSLIDDLLTLSRMRSTHMDLDAAAIDLVQVVRSAERAILPRVRSAGLSLEMDLGATPLIVEGDAEKLERALVNLMSNAVKFTPHLGRITVRLRREDTWAVVTVADTGYGIPAEDVDRLFSQFFRSSLAMERHIQGTGLGLSIVRAIVEGHGGHIDVESVVDTGTTFKVHLPA